MKHLKIYEAWLGRNSDSPEVICRKYGIENFKINSDGSVDVEGDVFIEAWMGSILEVIKFNRVSGFFNCSFLKGLTTLKNLPNYVGQNFRCSNNKLTTLVEGPNSV